MLSVGRVYFRNVQHAMSASASLSVAAAASPSSRYGKSGLNKECTYARLTLRLGELGGFHEQ